jgi:TolB-like protein/Tfp pilus assembly protein PilF
VEHAVTRALAPVAADRFESAAEFARVLQRIVITPTATPTGLPAPALESPAGRRPAPAGPARRQVPVAALALVLGVLIGLGVLFAWRRSDRGGEDGRGAGKRVAVLPFENLGESADAYFADGVANDLRTKLSQIAGLAVIARSSSNEYRETTKPAQQIARELGVDYLLTATIQWEKVAGGASRVRVTPELVDVRPGQAPHTRWGQQFDAEMTGVFQVQADIAAQVAQALNVALRDSVKDELAAMPTQSLPAYDAFLRGEAASQGLARSDPPGLRQAIAAYEQAVALDSTFFLAWAHLARAQAALYFNSTPTPARAEAARRAAERAVSLAPHRPEGHHALSMFYRAVLGDSPRALAEDSIALALAPGNAEVLASVGGTESQLGRWEAARMHLEQAARLDPRSITTLLRLGTTLLWMRHHPEAEQFFDRALRLAPTNLDVLQERAMVPLAQGDLAGAQAVLRAAPKEVDPTALVAFMGWYWDLYWVLDETQQQLLLRLTPSAFDDDRGGWGIVLAQTYWLRGDRVRARAYADSARVAFEQQVQAAPQDDQRHVFLGLALAYLGQKAAAIREGEEAMTLIPAGRAARDGAYTQHLLARIYLLVGEPEKALDQLEPLLKMPYYLSPGWLKIDPTFDPLRGNPRFERLVNASP